ncbi:hypothetical protein [Nonomuraea sediminis]|uniref:hypothetical protein n=1 Tax=Nonomuraea sediminis TaxID=2835864 RepID=UPI001BDCE31F|nr:hypothetical protein [Nonomuraea sediminis]
MTRLRRALTGIAEEAPLVGAGQSLADAAIAGHRRRRRTRLVVGATAMVVALVATTAGAVAAWPRTDHTAAPHHTKKVPNLPDGRVGTISHAYQTPCEVDRKTRTVDCADTEWRVVTGTGTTYRVPGALARTRANGKVPVAISRDGRMLAYYSPDAHAHVVRDLESGAVVTSPVTMEEDGIGFGSMLALSDDGRYVVFDPQEGSKEPALLIDTRTGRKVSISGKYEVISVKNGVVQLVRYRKTDLWFMPVAGGGRPVRFDGTFIMFSDLSPDGRTVAAVEFSELRKRMLTLLDTGTGRTLRKLPLRGLPKGGSLEGVTTWLSGTEVTVVLSTARHRYGYVVDVTTGRSRRWAGYPTRRQAALALPGVSYSW